MCSVNFNDQFDTKLENGNCYLNFQGTFNQFTFEKDNGLSNSVSKINFNEIVINASLGGGKVMVLNSKMGAMCFSFGITDYSDYTKNYLKHCYIQTFESEGKTYLYIIYNHILQQIVDSCYKIYDLTFNKPLQNLYIRISDNPNTISNLLPTDKLERYLAIKLKPSSKDISNKLEANISITCPKGVNSQVIADKVNKKINQNKSIHDRQVKVRVTGKPPLHPSSKEDSSIPLTYYQNKYKMGECVEALKEYLENNPQLKLENYVYRMTATKEEGQYNGPLSIVNFTEKDSKNDYLNNHVILTDENKQVVDPLFAKEKINLDKYIGWLIREKKIIITPEYKEVIFDIQPLKDEYLKISRSKYVSNDPCMSIVYNIATNKCHWLS